MQALVKSRAEPGLWLENVPEPTLDADDVLIRVLRTGICGTDVHIWEWDEWAQGAVPVPTVTGHEFVGEIAGVGSNVRGFETGEIVSGEGHIVCGHCRNCLAGRRHLCSHTQGVGINRDGAFARFVVVPKGNVWRHHHGVDLDVAAIFDPFGNAVHTVRSFPVFGEDVLITGAGPIGQMAIPVTRMAGARNIVVTDLKETRLDLAREMGATLAVDPSKDPLPEVQKRLGMREGFDVGFEMSGSPAALREMVANMNHGGKIAVLGILNESPKVDWRSIVFKSLTIVGVYGREMYETWYKMSVLVDQGVDISPVITHRFSYREYQKAFDVMRSGDCGKVILNWEDAE